MSILDVISRVAHIGTAIMMVGGTIFMLFVLIPATKRLDDASRGELHSAVVSRWKRFVHIGILLFLVSGFYNYVRAIGDHKGDGLYHALVGTKILLALVIFFLASVLVGRSAKFEIMRSNRAKWLLVIVAFAAVIVAISGYLKVSH